MSQTFKDKPGVFSQCKDARRDIVGLQSFQSLTCSFSVHKFTRLTKTGKDNLFHSQVIFVFAI